MSEKKSFSVKQECKSCRGTGLYAGFAEHDGFAVVCHSCKGTGCQSFVHEYTEFTDRKESTEVKTVLDVNPGISVGNGFDFGGMPYEDWKSGKPFPAKSEMRKFVCPAWWYQSADYDKKPDWDECTRCGSFSGCTNFNKRSECWARFDRGNP